MIKNSIAALLIALAFTGGALSGSWVAYKWSLAQEADRLKVALEIKDQERKAALAALKQYYEDLPPVELIKTEIEEAIKYVSTNPDCDVSPAEQRVLDYARTGVRDPSPGFDAGPGKPGATETPERVPRAVEVRAHGDAGIRFQECFAVAKAVELYLKSRAKDQR